MRKAAAQPAAGLWFDRIFRGDKWVHVVWKCFRPPGFDAALIGGTVAEICCESSARCDDAEYRASSANFWNALGEVMTLDHVIAKLNPAASGVAA